MADVHGVDVSWMAHGPSKDKAPKNTPPSSTPKNAPKPSSLPRQPIGSPPPPTATTATSDATATSARSHTRQRSNSTNSHGPVETSDTNGGTETKPIPIPKAGGLSRSNSVDRNATPPSPSSQRRPSWFSNISSKFSPSTPPSLSSAESQSPSQAKPGMSKSAVLAQGAKHQGDAPYTPAPPRANPGNNILGIFRRLSSSAAGLGHGIRGTHGLVERKVLNIDSGRERCDISELDEAKLRRVAFCVDVEIAPQPKYDDDAKLGRSRSDTQPDKNGDQITSGGAPNDAASGEGTAAPGAAKDKDTDATKKKKEKKKKNEEERKARKEKKRKMAEANGTVPVEIRRASSDSSGVSDGRSDKGLGLFHVPTINPVRIYRRCCQLRETPILKKITEQLTDSTNWSPETGFVEKLDLSGYWMQLPDLITLGDYLAVVPVREIFLEGCGLTDEGLRVVLAGLLAAKKPDFGRRKYANYADHSAQGGVVERLVLKGNKLGPEGWRHLCLFIYLCRSISFLDLSGIPFPHLAANRRASQQNGGSPPPDDAAPPPSDISHLLSKSLAGRLAGSHLELLNLGDTNPAMAQLGVIVDGAIQCGLRRLGLAHNSIDGEGVEHVSRFLEAGKCEGLDLGGNDLRDHVEAIVKAVPESHSLWALSLADCNLMPASVCNFFPTLAKLKDFRFIDLSHNQELCKEDTKTIQMLRRHLPKMKYLKRIHLTDVSMTSEQAIALAEIIPEIPQLANITLTGNPELAKLADAQSESAREEACALYASFLAAARVSKTLISVEIEVPGEGSGEIVKALAKQVVAYCLRNMERLQVGDLEELASAETVVPYPDVLAHLVGRDENAPNDPEADTEEAPDEDYVIGGTGVVKALACCLKNCGDDHGSRRASLDAAREAEAEVERLESGANTPRLAPGKAKDMSKHLLSSARKIRARLQPALARARGAAPQGAEDLRKLSFLDQTLSGIIRRFEDEFPETREAEGGYFPAQEPAAAELEARIRDEKEKEKDGEKDGERDKESEGEDDDSGLRPGSSSSSSSLHTVTRPLDTEEGRTHRRGHRFRTSIVHSPEKYEEVLLASLDEMERDPQHVRMLREMIGDLGDPVLDDKLVEKGPVRVFREDGGRVVEALRAVDPEHWERFRESQVMARENVWVGRKGEAGEAVE